MEIMERRNCLCCTIDWHLREKTSAVHINSDENKINQMNCHKKSSTDGVSLWWKEREIEKCLGPSAWSIFVAPKFWICFAEQTHWPNVGDSYMPPCSANLNNGAKTPLLVVYFVLFICSLKHCCSLHRTSCSATLGRLWSHAARPL